MKTIHLEVLIWMITVWLFSYEILSCLTHFPDTIDVMVERTYRNATSMVNAVADSPISTEVGGSNARFRVRPTP
jgi:hypothetical protein